MSRLVIKGYCTLAMIFQISAISATSAVTYSLSGGRLGDNLVAYLHAKWIAFQYDLSFVYKPFPYSDQFALHAIERANGSMQKRDFRKTITWKKNEYVCFWPAANALYVIPYFPESLEEYRVTEFASVLTQKEKKHPHFDVDWEYTPFLEQIRTLIRPATTLKLVEPPASYLSIAVHVRKNSQGIDNLLLSETVEMGEALIPNYQYVDQAYPLKFPPDSYYIEGIKSIAALFPDPKIYVFLFTDHPRPEELIAKYAALVNDERIMFDCRVDGSSIKGNVLEDFFSIFNFDCLIRSDSSYALVASKVGKFKAVCSPVYHRWNGNILNITRMTISVDKEA